MGILFFFLGAFTNRFVRGSDLATKMDNWVAMHFPDNAKALQFIISADFLNFLIFLVGLSVVGDYPAWQTLLISVAMWIGAAPTWGQYIGAMLNDYEPPFTRNKWFDFIPNMIVSDKLAGAVGLTLRGLFWGGLLALASWSAAPLFVGAFMAGFYWLAHKFSEVVGKGHGWTFGEFIFGGCLWVSVL